MKAISNGMGWDGCGGRLRVGVSALALSAYALTLGAGCRNDAKPAAKSVSAVRSSTTPQLALGRTAVYSLELESDVDYGQDTGLALSLRSAVELQRLPDVAPGVTAFDLTLPDARFAIPEGSEREFAELAAELARGVVLEMQAGKVSALRSDGNPSAFGASILRSVAAALELPQPLDPAAQRWTAETSDSAGRCTVEITAAAANKYLKKKLSYRASSLAAPPGVALDMELVPTVLESNGTLVTGTEGVSSSSYEERLEMALAGSAKARAHNRLVLRLASTKTVALRQRGPTQPLAAPEPKAASVDRGALDAAKIGNFTFDSALQALAASAKDAAPLLATDSARRDETPEQSAARERRLNEHNRVFSAMTAILRSQPETVPRAIALVRAATPAAKLLVDALAAADTAPCTTALLGLVADKRLGAELRAAVTHDLARVDTPTTETVAALEKLLDTPEYGLIAWYGLGTAARHLRDGGQHESAERLGSLLATRLAQAPDTESRVHALRAIANSGLATLLPAVQPRLTDHSEMVRSAAVEALRLMDTPEADQLIAGRLAQEESAFVRRAVLNAAKARRPNQQLRAAVVAAADHDTDDHGRFAAISLLVRWLPQDPTLRGPLSRIADNDSVPALRNAARAAL